MVHPTGDDPAPVSAASPAPGTLVLVVGGTVVRTDAPSLCLELRRLVGQGDGRIVICDVGAVTPDVDTIHVLARLQLTARRLGGRILLREASDCLKALLDLAGLREVLACVDDSVEPLR